MRAFGDSVLSMGKLNCASGLHLAPMVVNAGCLNGGIECRRFDRSTKRTNASRKVIVIVSCRSGVLNDGNKYELAKYLKTVKDRPYALTSS